jgi:hypothetical protein
VDRKSQQILNDGSTCKIEKNTDNGEEMMLRTPALIRYFALVIGILFVLAGIGGFLPFITQPPPADAPSLRPEVVLRHRPV